MNTHDPNEPQAEQDDRHLNRTAPLETDLVIANQKAQALLEFMAEVRSHEDDLEDDLIEQKVKGNDPGASGD